jgi:hypothetical protein
MAGIALLSGPQDPSQLEALLNQLITQMNGYFLGTTPEVLPVTKGTTSTPLPGFGSITVNSTTRTAGTTGRYMISAPVPGQTLSITDLSTVTATITGLFARNKTKLTLKSTAALSAGGKLASVILTGLSTSAWGITSGFGNVATT